MQLVVGRIGRAHGVLGEATIEVQTDDPDTRFQVGNKLTLDDGRQLTIRSSRWHNQILLLAFDMSIEKLFEQENDFKEVIKKREIYQVLEIATDKIEDVSNVIESIIIKYA